ncbi:MAG: hypothetical protein ACJ757_02435 [Gaiellaceae bacterium]
MGATKTHLAIVSLTALAAFAVFFARAPVAGSEVRCAASRVHYEALPDGDPRLRALPWIAPEPRSVGLVGHLFYYGASPSVPWGKRRVGDLRMYSGGRSPDNRVNMKILWGAPGRDGTRLTLRGRRVGSSDTFVQILSVGPSIVNVPQPGCWQLTLTTGKLVTRLTATVVKGVRSP